MDLSLLNEYFVMVVVVACLVVGYIIKHATFFKWINNEDIPAILALNINWDTIDINPESTNNLPPNLWVFLHDTSLDNG